MYHDFFGFSEPPFELTANPKYLFFTTGHREALSNLQYGLASHKAVTVLIGEAGTGKTTLIRAALESESCRRTACVYINNPALTRNEFVETLARAFSLSDAAMASKAAMLVELEALLRSRNKSGDSLALVVDEAQRLSDELLEEIRLLANIETPDTKLLPLVIAGQPELADRLRADDLRQLRQRVSLRCEIQPFTLSDTASYVAHRIRTAGGQALNMFTREAIALIHEQSRGIPRTINVLSDNALVGGFARGVRRITSQIVADVCRDFDLEVRSQHLEETLPLRSTEPRATEILASKSHFLADNVTDLGALQADSSLAGGDNSVSQHEASRPLGLDAVTPRRRRFSLFG